MSCKGVTDERIPPNNGRLESRWVFGLIALIVVLSAFLHSQKQTVALQDQQHLTLDVGGKAMLTALLNAGDEIIFLAEDIHSLPSVAMLRDNLIPPFFDDVGAFDAYTFEQHNARCYLAVSQVQEQPHFLLVFTPAPTVYWSVSNQQPSITHCTVPDNWLTIHDYH